MIARMAALPAPSTCGLWCCTRLRALHRPQTCPGCFMGCLHAMGTRRASAWLEGRSPRPAAAVCTCRECLL